jgi:hypothetical protein
MRSLAVLAFVAGLSSHAWAVDSDGTIPDPKLTPGAPDLAIKDLDVICHHKTTERRHTTGSEKNAVYHLYGLTTHHSGWCSVRTAVPLITSFRLSAAAPTWWRTCSRRRATAPTTKKTRTGWRACATSWSAPGRSRRPRDRRGSCRIDVPPPLLPLPAAPSRWASRPGTQGLTTGENHVRHQERTARQAGGPSGPGQPVHHRRGQRALRRLWPPPRCSAEGGQGASDAELADALAKIDEIGKGLVTFSPSGQLRRSAMDRAPYTSRGTACCSSPTARLLVLTAYQDGPHCSIGFGSNSPALRVGDGSPSRTPSSPENRTSRREKILGRA